MSLSSRWTIKIRLSDLSVGHIPSRVAIGGRLACAARSRPSADRPALLTVSSSSFLVDDFKPLRHFVPLLFRRRDPDALSGTQRMIVLRNGFAVDGYSSAR